MSDEPPEKRLMSGETCVQAALSQGYHPVHDEAALKRFAKRGVVAWADVPNAAKWVKEIRGAAGE